MTKQEFEVLGITKYDLVCVKFERHKLVGSIVFKKQGEHEFISLKPCGYDFIGLRGMNFDCGRWGMPGDPPFDAIEIIRKNFWSEA